MFYIGRLTLQTVGAIGHDLSKTDCGSDFESRRKYSDRTCCTNCEEQLLRDVVFKRSIDAQKYSRHGMQSRSSTHPTIDVIFRLIPSYETLYEPAI